MLFCPTNGFIEVRPIVEGEKNDEENAGLVFPIDYDKKPDSEYSIVQYVQGPIETPMNMNANGTVFMVVASHMLQAFDFQGEKHMLIHKKDVVGYLQ